MSDIWFTSDLHFYHNNVIAYCNRPYKSVDAMNEGLISNWNSMVKPEDIVYCLGDFSLAIRPVELYSQRLNGTKYLIPGNHDWCHPYNKKSRGEEKRANQIAKYEAFGWRVLPISTTLEIGNVTVNLSHLPYTNVGDVRLDTVQNGFDKYDKYRPVDDGKWLICGHVHEKWKINGRMINVGVDVWDYKPVHVNQVLEIINVHHSTV